MLKARCVRSFISPLSLLLIPALSLTAQQQRTESARTRAAGKNECGAVA